MPRNGTTVRAAGRERRMRATRSPAEPRTPRRRLPGAVRAHDEGGGRHDGRGGTRTGAKSCHRVPGAFTMTAAERAGTPNHATRSRAPSPEPPRRPHRSARAHEAGGASHYGRGARHYDGGARHYDRGAVTMTAAQSL